MQMNESKEGKSRVSELKSKGKGRAGVSELSPGMLGSVSIDCLLFATHWNNHFLYIL